MLRLDKANTELDNTKLDKLIEQALLAHLSDTELEQHLAGELDGYDQFRADTHLRRCLICELRSGALTARAVESLANLMPQIAALYSEGLKAPEIAMRLSQPRYAIEEAVATLQIAALYSKGMKVSEIARQLSKSQDAVEETVARLREASPHPEAEKPTPPLWRAVVANKLEQIKQEVSKCLTETIELMLNQMGQLVESGAGPRGQL